jgi:hypothetical protein
LPRSKLQPHLFTIPPPFPLPPQKLRDRELREAGSPAPRCHFFNTFFLTKLLHLEDVPARQGVYDYKEVGGALLGCFLGVGGSL